MDFTFVTRTQLPTYMNAHAQETSKQAAISRYNEAFFNREDGSHGNILTFARSS